MKIKQNFAAGILSGFAMLIIILDARCAAESANAGVELCLRTVIPSLFPFFILSGILNSCLLGKNIPVLRPIGKLCGIPRGSESLLLLGFMTGYPVGAQLISQAYQQKSLTANTARRLLGFCNNAGPAFIFGMLSPIFTDKRIPWLLWGIHITSGMVVGCVLPSTDNSDCLIREAQPLSISKALYNALRSIATVCGWVVLFRVLIGYFDRWFMWRFPTSVQVVLSGFLELANGCVALKNLQSASLKFIIASGMLAFGGLCVGMQTQSVTQDLGSGYYFPGKVMQTLLSILMSIFMQHVISSLQASHLITLLLIASFFLIVIALHRKKVVAFGRRMLYNTHNHSTKGATPCYFERK